MRKLSPMCCVAMVSLLTAIALTGCARKNVMTRPAGEPEPSAPVESTATAEVALSEPSPPEPGVDPAMAAPVEVAIEPVSVPEPPMPPQPRTDGRPEWWSDLPAYEVERVWVCAEALGAGMSEAKESALERARRKLRDILRLPSGAGIPDEVVERTSVLPLPRAGGDHTYAGYVLISAAIP